jgi:hypothetical protein
MSHQDSTNSSDPARIATNENGAPIGATGAGGARPGQIMGGTIGPGTEPEDTAGATLEDMEVGPADGDSPGSAIPS